MAKNKDLERKERRKKWRKRELVEKGFRWFKITVKFVLRYSTVVWCVYATYELRVVQRKMILIQTQSIEQIQQRVSGVEQKLEVSIRPSRIIDEAIKAFVIQVGVSGAKQVTSIATSTLLNSIFSNSTNTNTTKELESSKKELESSKKELFDLQFENKELRFANDKFDEQNKQLRHRVDRLESENAKLENSKYYQSRVFQREIQEHRAISRDKSRFFKQEIQERDRRSQFLKQKNDQLRGKLQNNRQEIAQLKESKKLGFWGKLARHTVVGLFDIVKEKTTQPPSEAQEQYKFDKKRDHDQAVRRDKWFKNQRKKFKRQVDRAKQFRDKPTRKFSESSSGTKKETKDSVTRQDEDKKNKGSSRTFHSVYMANHPSRDDDTTKSYSNDIEKPKSSKNPLNLFFKKQ